MSLSYPNVAEPAVPEATVFFDGSCPLCRAEIDHYRRRDSKGALRLVDVSAPCPDLPAGLDRAAAMARFHVLAADGRLLSGAAAFAEVWRHVPLWRWAWRLATLPGMTRALEAGYRLFLPWRPRLARLLAKREGGR